MSLSYCFNEWMKKSDTKARKYNCFMKCKKAVHPRLPQWKIFKKCLVMAGALFVWLMGNGAAINSNARRATGSESEPLDFRRWLRWIAEPSLRWWRFLVNRTRITKTMFPGTIVSKINSSFSVTVILIISFLWLLGQNSNVVFLQNMRMSHKAK